MSAISNYANGYKNPPVTSKIPGSNQVKNNTGGYVYEVTPKNRLERFLILGTDGGSYYVGEKDLTQQNVDFIINLIKSDSTLVLDTVHEVSTSGRSYRNSAAIFVLALILNHGSGSDKSIAASIAPEIARTATMVYELANYIDKLGGWGRSKRRAIANWFTSKTPDELAFQAVKYRQRNGWTLRDLMRLSHPVGVDQHVGKFVLGNYMGKFSDYDPQMPGIIHGFTEMLHNETLPQVIETLDRYPSLPWETIPTQFLKNPEVWKTLFYNGSLKGQALLRNVTRLAKIDAFADIKFAGDYAKKLTDGEMIRKTRLHPVQYLLAGLTYDRGQSVHGSGSHWGYDSRQKSWTTNTKIKQALEAGFYDSFATVTPSGKAIRIGVDVSGSMSWGMANGADVTAAEAAALMALVTARVEDNVEILGFANTLRDLGISPSDSFDTVIRKTKMNNFGYTDPSLLINHAKHSGAEGFLVVTDNEVNHGNHPKTALDAYRKSTGINAKLVVMGMTATNFTIADPSDRGMMDVVGFDSNAPKVVSDFFAGRI